MTGNVWENYPIVVRDKSLKARLFEKITFFSSCREIVVVGLAGIWKENLIIAKCLLETERRVPRLISSLKRLENPRENSAKSGKHTYIYNRDYQAGLYVCYTGKHSNCCLGFNSNLASYSSLLLSLFKVIYPSHFIIFNLD